MVYSFHFKIRNFRLPRRQAGLLFFRRSALKFITVATAMPTNFALLAEKTDCPYSSEF